MVLITIDHEKFLITIDHEKLVKMKISMDFFSS